MTRIIHILYLVSNILISLRKQEEFNMDKKDDRVSVTIPKGFANEEPNVLVSVNAVNYVLPRGKTSLVPREVAWELERAAKAQQTLDEHMDRMLQGGPA